MVKLTVLYAPPTDAAAFDKHYFEIHIPIVDKIPGILGNEVSKITGSLDGSTPPYYLQAELYFDTADALMAGFGSSEGQAAAADVANFATAEVTMMVSDVVKQK